MNVHVFTGTSNTGKSLRLVYEARKHRENLHRTVLFFGVGQERNYDPLLTLGLDLVSLFNQSFLFPENPASLFGYAPKCPSIFIDDASCYKETTLSDMLATIKWSCPDANVFMAVQKNRMGFLDEELVSQLQSVCPWTTCSSLSNDNEGIHEHLPSGIVQNWKIIKKPEHTYAEIIPG